MEELIGAEALKAAYRSISTQYRSDDELEVRTENHRYLSGMLERLCSSFRKPIDVLDAGCGTGRYFHCLTNVKTLVGVDLSPEMLAAAEQPVLSERIQTDSIQLLCANIYTATFPPGSFDFIYSMGVFGYGCPVTTRLCNRFYEWLAPAGILFFNVLDFNGLTLGERLRKTFRGTLNAIAPQTCRGLLGTEAVPFFGLKRSELKRVLRASHFQKWNITSNPCRSPLGTGKRLECVAVKGTPPEPHSDSFSPPPFKPHQSE